MPSSNKNHLVHGYDITQYSFDFAKLMKYTEFRANFLEHLKTEYNTEPLLFINATELLFQGSTDNDIAFVQAATKVYYEFVFQQQEHTKISFKQINISGKSLRNMQSSFDIEALAEKAKQIRAQFAMLYDIIFLELCTENFPRFVRSNYFLQFLRQMGAKFVDQVASLVISQNFPYTSADFERPVVTDKDFSFFYSLLQDSFDWELQGMPTCKISNS